MRRICYQKKILFNTTLCILILLILTGITVMRIVPSSSSKIHVRWLPLDDWGISRMQTHNPGWDRTVTKLGCIEVKVISSNDEMTTKDLHPGIN